MELTTSIDPAWYFADNSVAQVRASINVPANHIRSVEVVMHGSQDLETDFHNTQGVNETLRYAKSLESGYSALVTWILDRWTEPISTTAVIIGGSTAGTPATATAQSAAQAIAVTAAA